MIVPAEPWNEQEKSAFRWTTSGICQPLANRLHTPSNSVIVYPRQFVQLLHSGGPGVDSDRLFRFFLNRDIRMSIVLLRRSAAALLAATMFSSLVAAQDAPKLETDEQKASYGIGFNIGSSILRDGLALDPALIAAGIEAALKGQKSAVTTEEIQAAMESMSKKKSAEKLKSNAKFLEENKAKKGVQVTKSGLQYTVIKEGTGDKPTAKSRVKTHYRGKLLNGTVFDQSYEGDAPAAADMPVEFGVTQVIKGWTEALQLMKPGAHYRLFIPSELAYGERGTPGGPIGPNEVLIFEIHLLEASAE